MEDEDREGVKCLREGLAKIFTLSNPDGESKHCGIIDIVVYCEEKEFTLRQYHANFFF